MEEHKQGLPPQLPDTQRSPSAAVRIVNAPPRPTSGVSPLPATAGPHDEGTLDLGSAFDDGGDQAVSRWNADDGSSEHVRNSRDDANARSRRQHLQNTLDGRCNDNDANLVSPRRSGHIRDDAAGMGMSGGMRMAQGSRAALEGSDRLRPYDHPSDFGAYPRQANRCGPSRAPLVQINLPPQWGEPPPSSSCGRTPDAPVALPP